MSYDMKNINTYFQLYNENDRLYDRVLRRHFGNRNLKVRDKLVESGYFKKATLLRCPECDYAMFDTAQEFTGDYLKEREQFCNACDSLIKTTQLISEPVLIRTNKTYINEPYKEGFKLEYKYDYGKRCKELNKIQKDMFDNIHNEPERNVVIAITLPDGKKITLDNPVEFTAYEITTDFYFKEDNNND